MKRMLTVIIVFNAFWLLLASPEPSGLLIITPEVIRPYDALFEATCRVESSGDRFAIGDKHMKEHSYGIVQIRKSRLDDYFRQTGIRYSVHDMFDVEKSKEVFMWYCTGQDFERIARCWNGGEKGMNKKSTLKYWKKIKSEML